jgi:NNP family nitrate/nitrite transporter-like MFS transporter
MSSAGAAGPQPGAYRALFLATLAFALCFAVWGLVSPLATQFQELYELSSTQISVVIATPVILRSLFRIPIGLLTDRFGGRVVFAALMLILVVPTLFIGLLGGSFGGLLFWGFFLGLAGSSFAVGVPFVNKWFPPHMQGLVLGVYGMGNIGSAIAAYAAPAIAAFYGWQWAFWVFIVPLVAMAVVFWILGRDAPGQARGQGHPIRGPGQGHAAAGQQAGGQGSGLLRVRTRQGLRRQGRRDSGRLREGVLPVPEVGRLLGAPSELGGAEP